MSAGENFMIVVGNAGQDAEMSYVGENKTPLCRFQVAVSDKRNGKEYVTWVPVVTWNVTAQIASEIKKGDSVYVRGAFVNEKWEKAGETQSRNAMTGFIVKKLAKGGRRESGNDEAPQPRVPPPNKGGSPF
jgi:single stranded DNA-binding protein